MRNILAAANGINRVRYWSRGGIEVVKELLLSLRGVCVVNNNDTYFWGVAGGLSSRLLWGVREKGSTY